MEFYLASGNAHKAKELGELFDPEVIKVNAAPEKLEVIEDADTFRGNAFLKAKAYYDKFKVPVIADDSGLCVEALPDELGIYSARFGGEGLDYTQKCQLVLEKLQDKDIREAYFVCYLCCYINPDEIFYFEGRLNGVIADEIKGEQGFGYDPVFIPERHPEGLSLAQDADWKKKNSHRALACEQAQKFFKNGIAKMQDIN